MSDAEWPATCDLTEAARLFAERGVNVHPSNLSRYVADRNFPSTKPGRSRLVDPEALFAAYYPDYSRRIAAGEASRPAAPPPAAAKSAPPSDAAPDFADPKRDIHRLQAQRLRADMAAKARELIPVEEAAAAAAEAVANLRSSLTRARNETAGKLMEALGAPANRRPAVDKLLDDMIRAAQAEFAATFDPLIASAAPPDMRPADYLDRLVAFAIGMREGGAPPANETQPEPAAAPQPEPVSAK